MLLTKREEQLLKAFQDFGKLSVDNIVNILQVSKRTVYRTLTDLGDTLSDYDIAILKEGNRYYLAGDINVIQQSVSQESYNNRERRQRILFELLVANKELTNEELQEKFLVSNVTIIQDIAAIEERLNGFDVILLRQKGYSIRASVEQKRHLIAILLTNVIPSSQFSKGQYGDIAKVFSEELDRAREVFKKYLPNLPEMEGQLIQFFTTILALANFEQLSLTNKLVSKLALDTSQNIFGALSLESGQFFSITEMLFFASILDDCILKRQEIPLFQENFDSAFYYKISNLIDKVEAYTKISFSKDPLLFKLLFNHIRLNLTVPTLFPDMTSASLTHAALKRSDYLHRVVSLLIEDIFPSYLQNETEYELITLHFAASLQRSPHIYPVSILLLTDERPLAIELLMTRIKNIAPFVETIRIASPSQSYREIVDNYDLTLTTSLLTDKTIKQISIYPDTKELLELQVYLQDVQLNREFKARPIVSEPISYSFKDYLTASQELLDAFTFITVENIKDFEKTVLLILEQMDGLQDKAYLSDKLLSRFEISPLAIPETHLALLHAQSSRILKTSFTVAELKVPVTAMSMAHEEEEIKRVLVMLTKLDESEEIRHLMTAISQSLIENKLYTEIYKTGNSDIIYQLLNQIFTEKIKKLEN